jgi:hypothetical protein
MRLAGATDWLNPHLQQLIDQARAPTLRCSQGTSVSSRRSRPRVSAPTPVDKPETAAGQRPGRQQL